MMSLRRSTIDFHSRLIELSKAPQSVGEYCQSIVNEAAPDVDFFERARLGAVVRQLAAGVYDDDLGKAAGDLLEDPRTVVSLAEHHASIAHPLTMSALATESLYALLSGARLISLTCGTVPLDNELFPRGAFVAGHKVPFVAGRYRRRTALRSPRLDHELFTHNLGQLHRDGRLDGPVYEALREWWFELGPELCGKDQFWQQISIMNRRAYERMFDIGVPAPVMIPIELVARDMLIADLDARRDTWLERSLFVPEMRSALIAALDGIRCFWNVASGRGTFMFWYVDADERLQRLRPDGDFLVTPGGQRVCRTDPEPIRSAVRRGELLPAASYTLLRLALQCRLRNFGGPLQYDYLANAKRRILSRLTGHLNRAELAEIEAVPLSYYLNFAEKKPLRGELERIVSPIGPADIDLIAAERIEVIAREDLTWIDSVLADY